MDESSILLYVIGGGVLALVYGGWAGMSVLNMAAGNEEMQKIAGAIQEGAKAYMSRQYMTIFL